MLQVVLFPRFDVLYFCVSTFRSMRAVHNMAAFCSSLIACFAAMLPRYCLNDLLRVPVAPVITGITFVCTFHVHCVCTSRYCQASEIFPSKHMLHCTNRMCNLESSCDSCDYFIIWYFCNRLIISYTIDYQLKFIQPVRYLWTDCEKWNRKDCRQLNKLRKLLISVLHLLKKIGTKRHVAWMGKFEISILIIKEKIWATQVKEQRLDDWERYAKTDLMWTACKDVDWVKLDRNKFIKVQIEYQLMKQLFRSSWSQMEKYK
jgi:hypothetical protein